METANNISFTNKREVGNNPINETTNIVAENRKKYLVKLRYLLRKSNDFDCKLIYSSFIANPPFVSEYFHNIYFY